LFFLGLYEKGEVLLTRHEKNMRFIVPLIGLSLLLVTFFTPAKAEEITVTDSAGRNVIITKDPQRIAALGFDSVELIRLMGAIDRIVGTSHFVKLRDYIYPEIADMADVGIGTSVEMEGLIRLKPDLVITFGMVGDEFADHLRPFGIETLLLDFYRSETVLREAGVLGEVLGGDAPLKAEEYVSWVKGHEDNIRKIVAGAGENRPTYIIEHYTDQRVYGRASGTFQAAAITGARNLADVFERSTVTVDPEWVLKQNPDVYVKVVSLTGVRDREKRLKILEAAKENLLSRSGWKDMKAAKNNRVYVLDSSQSNGIRYIIGLYKLCHWIYPELFPEDISQKVDLEYWRRFQGMEVGW
jgi:iron complex transport system substrate-binding protein